MGLDMEIRRISKPHMDDSVIYNHEDIRGIILTEDNLKYPSHAGGVRRCEQPHGRHESCQCERCLAVL